MTGNWIKWQSVLEEQRHNKEVEREQRRSNMEKENETWRTNLAHEKLERERNSEALRHNLSTEGLTSQKQGVDQFYSIYSAQEQGRHNYAVEQENVRHNQATEMYSLLGLEESGRHNLATEGVSRYVASIDEAYKQGSLGVQWSNLSELNRHQLAVEAETSRHNTEGENLSMFGSLVGGKYVIPMLVAGAAYGVRKAWQSGIDISDTMGKVPVQTVED